MLMINCMIAAKSQRSYVINIQTTAVSVRHLGWRWLYSRGQWHGVSESVWLGQHWSFQGRLLFIRRQAQTCKFTQCTMYSMYYVFNLRDCV
jgi:hypothetical protein